MIEAANPIPIRARHKAITAFFPYAARWERNGRRELLDTFLRAARASGKRGFMWYRIRQPATALLGGGGPVSLKQAIILASPHLPWQDPAINGHFVQLWAAATRDVPYTHDIGQCVVDTLLLIAPRGTLRQHIPVDMWSWLNKRPCLPPACTGGSRGTERDVVQTVRGLGDVETLTSYLLHVWSEWEYLYPDGLEEMCVLIREDFSGIGMGDRRRDLLQRLHHVLGQLNLGLEPIRQREQGLSGDDVQSMKGQYGRLREALLTVDEEAIDVMTRESLRLAITLSSLLTHVGACRIPLITYVRDSPPVVVCPGYPPIPLSRNPTGLSASMPFLDSSCNLSLCPHPFELLHCWA